VNVPVPVTVPGSEPGPEQNQDDPMKEFDHEKLDVYVAAIDFVVLANEVVEHLPKGRSYLALQLQRAATSVGLNIAEGAGEFSGSDKARFYRMARRSATECAAILHVCERLKLVDESRYVAGRELLLRIVSMLVQMVRRLGKAGAASLPGTVTGTGTFTGSATERS
jgi:four helix bundle protein